MSTSGYPTVVASPPFIAYNPGGADVVITSVNSTTFAFDSVIIASAWRDNLVWSIYAYQGNGNVIAGSFFIQVLNQTIISCGVCSDLNALVFTTSGGTPHLGLAQNGTEFAFDNLCLSFGY